MDVEGTAWNVTIDGWENVSSGKMWKEGQEKVLLLMENGCFGYFLTFSLEGKIGIKMHLLGINLDVIFGEVSMSHKW